jgi:hypothetical protein
MPENKVIIILAVIPACFQPESSGAAASLDAV